MNNTKRIFLASLLTIIYSPLYGIVGLKPTSFDRTIPSEQITRDPLSVSFSNGEGPSVRSLRGTIIVGLGSRPQTRLQRAVADNNAVILNQLLAQGEDPNVMNHHGFTALHFAAALGYDELVASLLRYHADPNLQDDLYKITPLHLAIAGLHKKSIALLIQHGAQVNIPDIYGYTPLHNAAVIGDVEIATILINSGAHPNAATFEKTTAMFQCSNSLLSTPLHEAATHGKKEIVELLVAHKAHIDSLTATGETPLAVAIINGHLDIAHYLLGQGSDIKKADMLLPKVAYAGDVTLAKLLIDSGAKVNALIKVENLSTTALHQAVQSKNNPVAITTLLLNHEGSINSSDSDGCTPLHFAVSFSTAEIVTFLVEQGADVNIANKEGVTPLHSAVFYNKLDIVKLLLDNGALIDAKTDHQETPLGTALRVQNRNIAALLRAHRAKEDVCSDNKIAPSNNKTSFVQKQNVLQSLDSESDDVAEKYEFQKVLSTISDAFHTHPLPFIWMSAIGVTAVVTKFMNYRRANNNI